MSIFAFPVNLILALVFLCAIYLTFPLYKKSGFLQSRKLLLGLMLSLIVAMAVEGTFKLNLMHKLPFLALVLATCYLTGLCVMDAVTGKKSVSYICSHLGFFLILFGGFFGAPDFTSASLPVSKDIKCPYARDSRGLTVPLDFKIELKEFKIDCYQDGTSPKQYTSTILLDDKTATTSVNHPCYHKGWLIYQSDFDRKKGEYSVLTLVRDPWLPVTFLGMALLAFGALAQLRKTWHSPKVIPIAIIVAIAFGAISLAKINFGTLMPSLRSLWFVPHLIIYMLAYSVLAISLISALLKNPKAQELSEKLLSTASVLLIIGMLCGAVWAKMAWGDYWTWDAKECWAAVTWLLTLVGSHLPLTKKRVIIVLVILLSFLAMQVTWYGVNYLPSAKYSMHTYNSK